MSARKKALISGASSGIGKATARRFAAEGYDVCLNARREHLLEQLIAELPEGHHLICPGDYGDSQTAERLQVLLAERWGRVDVLVNCAGVCQPSDPFAASLADWRQPFDLLLNGAAHLTRPAVALMPDGGRIIHVTSIHGERVEKGFSSYAVAKAAINQYCRALAVELAPRNILVNAIAPGFVDTPMSVVNGVNELEGEWFQANYVEGHHLPLRRAGQPEEIAGVAWFLAGPDASYITGQVLTVDGGLTLTF